jgi:hypothetical protein
VKTDCQHIWKAICPSRPSASKAQKSGVELKPQLTDNAHDTEENSEEPAEYESEVEVEQHSWSDNLDATKNRGYPAREEGRYGSYPSHDGFDDESEP